MVRSEGGGGGLGERLMGWKGEGTRLFMRFWREAGKASRYPLVDRNPAGENTEREVPRTIVMVC